MKDKIPIKIKFVATLDIQGIESGDFVKLDKGSDINDFLSHVGIPKKQQRYIIPFVNEKAAKRSYKLEENDEVSLFLAIGGG